MATYNTVPFTNYTDANFTFTYDKELYAVKAGETVQYPLFLAQHGAKHLADRELIRAGKIKSLNDVDARNEIYEKILGKPDVKPQPVEPFVGNGQLPTEEIDANVEQPFPDKPVDLPTNQTFAKV